MFYVIAMCALLESTSVSARGSLGRRGGFDSTSDDESSGKRACPAEAPIREGKCECTSPILFFNQDTWTCVSCPGTLMLPLRTSQSYRCICKGKNQIFYRRNASCYTCPFWTRIREECLCPWDTKEKFDYTSGQCSCPFGQTTNASGVCAFNPPALKP